LGAAVGVTGVVVGWVDPPERSHVAEAHPFEP
jgi:hypothetical protein